MRSSRCKELLVRRNRQGDPLKPLWGPLGLPAGEELLLEEENPGVLEDLDQRDSLIWVFLEELGDQVFVLLRNARLESNLRSCLISSDGLLIAPKRCVSMDQLKE